MPGLVANPPVILHHSVHPMDPATICVHRELRKHVDDSSQSDSSHSSSSPLPKRQIHAAGVSPATTATSIRSKYLHRLGLETRDEQRYKSIQHSGQCWDATPKCQRIRLKEGGSRSRRSKHARPPPHTKISFDPYVSVREIPSHHDYSKRIKETVWMLESELRLSITRNTIEFMAEGGEPEKVLEEKDFIVKDGKLVHPITLVLDKGDNDLLRDAYYGKITVP